MANTDLRSAINALSDIVINRPIPLRETDQIYMKLADMYLQAEHVSKYMKDKNVIFIGDGDGIALSLVHLRHQEFLDEGPKSILVVDFDERVINSIAQFAKSHNYQDLIHGELYNVADPLPKTHISAFDVFYSNPPFGSCNNGKSVEIFVRRGMEATSIGAYGCIVIADDESRPWTGKVLYETQRYLITAGFRIVEMIPKFHKYHLDDATDLTSCSLIVKSNIEMKRFNLSQPITASEKNNFYGQDLPLKWKYVKDVTNGRKFSSRDFEFVGFEIGR